MEIVKPTEQLNQKFLEISDGMAKAVVEYVNTNNTNYGTLAAEMQKINDFLYPKKLEDDPRLEDIGVSSGTVSQPVQPTKIIITTDGYDRTKLTPEAEDFLIEKAKSEEIILEKKEQKDTNKHYYRHENLKYGAESSWENTWDNIENLLK